LIRGGSTNDGAKILAICLMNICAIELRWKVVLCGEDAADKTGFTNQRIREIILGQGIYLFAVLCCPMDRRFYPLPKVAIQGKRVLSLVSKRCFALAAS